MLVPQNGQSDNGQTPEKRWNPQPVVIPQGEPLAELLNCPEDAYNARLMLRSWFLSYALGEAESTTFNPDDLRGNVYFYEVMDGFLGSLYAPKAE